MKIDWGKKMLRCLLFSVVSCLVVSPEVLASEEFGREVIDQLQRSDSDLSTSHNFDFYLYLSDESTAKAACARVKEKGMRVQVRKAAVGNEWLCLSSVSAVPGMYWLSEMGGFFSSIAEEYGGEFDGWEASVAR